MNPGQVDVWRIGLMRPWQEVTALYELLDPGERSRASMFRAERDRRRFVVARAALRSILGEYAGLEPHRVKLTVRDGGKPILGDCARTVVHFNLSHSGDLALCAIADREVGVDLEQLRCHDDMQRVARHFFSAVEVRTLESLSGIARTHFFFRTWVRKEAYLKASGDGLARDTTGFSVTEIGCPVTLHTSKGCKVDDSYNVYDLPDIDEHFAAVGLAAVGSAPAIRYQVWQT